MDPTRGIVSCLIRFAAFYEENAFSDPNWVSVGHQIWTIAEPSLYYIASVLPMLRPIGLTVWDKASQVLRSSGLYGSSSMRSYDESGHGAEKGDGSSSLDELQREKGLGLETVPTSRTQVGVAYSTPQGDDATLVGRADSESKEDSQLDLPIMRTREVIVEHEHV